MISIWVDGIPKGQPRPRAFARKIGNKFMARVYDDGTAEAWKQQVIVNARPQRPAAALEGPLSVAIDFFLPRPKSRCRKSDPQGQIPCTSKPDCDNLAKAVLDALTQDGWWIDDAQVVYLAVRKFWPGVGATTGAALRIETWK